MASKISLFIFVRLCTVISLNTLLTIKDKRKKNVFVFFLYAIFFLMFYVMKHSTHFMFKAHFDVGHGRGVNLYSLHIRLTDFCDLHRLMGVRCNPY